MSMNENFYEYVLCYCACVLFICGKLLSIQRNFLPFNLIMASNPATSGIAYIERTHCIDTVHCQYTGHVRYECYDTQSLDIT